MTLEYDIAREELIWRLLEGKSVDGCELWNILDHDMDQRLITWKEVSAHFLACTGYTPDDPHNAIARGALADWLRMLVERWIDAREETIRRHAAEIES